MDATLRIKNLSIALEALSHSVTSLRNFERISAIEELLDEEIRTFKEEKEKENQWPQRPAKPTVYDKDPYAKDDEIPF